MIDFKGIEGKWREEWAKKHAFEPSVELSKKKFLATFPYPYMNGYLHLGHFYSIMRTEVFSRYKRHKGFNVLFPQGWHCTGSPIESVAKRIRENEPKQLETMKKQGFSEEQVQQFSDPTFWTEFFPKAGEKDLKNLGLSIDFRRQFITTNLNPHYDKFIEWQFRKLKEGGFVVKGNHPVVWCPKDNWPVGDHDRTEGEGETPQEFLLIKHRLKSGEIIITATLRPDTILGITNLYINPNTIYQKIEVDKEQWIVSKTCIPLLESQGFLLLIKGEIKGADLVGKHVEVVGGRSVLILPASFVDPNFGTGIVHSVPSDSADDLIALLDIQKDEKTIQKYALPKKEVESIVPIPVLNTPGFGEVPSKVLLEKYNVKSQQDKKTLETIRNELYKLSFYSATFNDQYGSFFSIDLRGKPVQLYKTLVKEELIKKGHAKTFYQLTGKVVCRCLTPSVVKVVRDQWFLNYSDPKWKEDAHACLKEMKLYPEKSRQQFDHVIDWLQNWACVREHGLGTNLPWDKKWVIEALSDSTIYMAYYTIAHLIKEMDPAQITDETFEYIFYGKGEPSNKLELKKMREEFEYWYPMDFRNSGKDLIQNHLTMSIFNHVALFPKKHLPQSFGVNGWVTVDGKKMSKSAGNFILLKELIERYPIDASRITILSGGEGLDDPNWDSEFAKSAPAKLDALYTLCTQYYGKGREDIISADKWMEAKLHQIIRDTEKNMEETLFRSAILKVFFDLPKAVRQYLRKTQDNPNKKIISEAIEAQIVMLSPFAPFLSEEMWQGIGKVGLVSHAKWPLFDESKIDEKATYLDEFVSDVRRDIDAVLRLTKIDSPKKITLLVSAEWKYPLASFIKDQLQSTRNPGEILKNAMHTDLLVHQEKISKLIPKLVMNQSSLPQTVLSAEEEKDALVEASKLFSGELKCEIEVILSEKSSHPKSDQSFPGKPSILIE